MLSPFQSFVVKPSLHGFFIYAGVKFHLSEVRFQLTVFPIFCIFLFLCLSLFRPKSCLFLYHLAEYGVFYVKGVYNSYERNLFSCVTAILLHQFITNPSWRDLCSSSPIILFSPFVTTYLQFCY